MRFYNSGKFTHQLGKNKETGEMIEKVLDLAPQGYDVGTAIVNFPGHQFCRVVKMGEWVDLPADLSEHMVKSQCPSLLTETEHKAAKSASKAKE